MRKPHSPCAPKAGHRQSSVNHNRKKRRAVLSRCTGTVLEQLESRQLLSSSINVSNGVLTLTGDPVKNNSLVASLDSNGKVVHASAGFGHISTIPTSSIKQIKIVGGSGGDYVYVTTTLKVPVTVVSGNGNDTIQGGGGSNDITAGTGKDWINLR